MLLLAHADARAVQLADEVVILLGVRERFVRNNLKSIQGHLLEAEARIWPSLSCLCHIRSTAELGGHADARAVQLADEIVVLTPGLEFSASRLAGQNLVLTGLRP